MTCLSCGIEIPAARVLAVRELRGGNPVYCVECQTERDAAIRMRPEHVPDAMAESEIRPCEAMDR